MNYHDESPAMKAMIKARVNLTLDQPFFGTLALRMRLIEDPKCPTAAINGKVIKFNPTWVMTLSGPQRKALLAHEVMHIVYLHHLRLSGRNHQRWNIAGDFVINPVLEGAGFTLPEGGCNNPAWAGMTTDRIYNLLPPGTEGSGSGDGEGGGSGFGDVDPMPGDGTESEALQEEQQVKIAVAQAATAAKMAGNLPANLERFVNDLMRPQIDWKEKLRTFLCQVARDDYSWSRPNRRFLPMGIYMPSLYSEKAKKFTVVIDTSGSIGQAELNAFFSELNGIACDLVPEEIDVIPCDARLGKVQTVTEYPIDPKSIHLGGGGGTCFRPPFEYYDQNPEREPQCLIYLTDMMGSFPSSEPMFPTLWVSTSHIYEAPFGEVCQIEVK